MNDIWNVKNKRYFGIGILVAAALVVLSTLLPYASVLGYSITLLLADGGGGDGIFFVILAVLCVVFLHLKKMIPMLVMGAIVCVMALYEMTQLSSGWGAVVTKGIGFYLMLLSSIALLVLCILYFVSDKKNRTNGPVM